MEIDSIFSPEKIDQNFQNCYGKKLMSEICMTPSCENEMISSVIPCDKPFNHHSHDLIEEYAVRMNCLPSISDVPIMRNGNHSISLSLA